MSAAILAAVSSLVLATSIHAPRAEETEKHEVDPCSEEAVLADSAGFESGPVVEPKVRSNPTPKYPKEPRDAHVEARVLVGGLIEKDGSVGCLKLVSLDVMGESGPPWDDVALASFKPQFEAAALEAVRRWRYEPALRNGKPVRAWFTVGVEFRLKTQ